MGNCQSGKPEREVPRWGNHLQTVTTYRKIKWGLQTEKILAKGNQMNLSSKTEKYICEKCFFGILIMLKRTPFNDEVDSKQQDLVAFNVILSYCNGKTRITETLGC